jgi:hypothetical protein
MGRKLVRRARQLHTDEWVALAGATVWAVALLVAAAAVPVYDGGPGTTGATLVDENGSGILLVIGVPLLMTILVGLALWFRGSRHGAGPIAWTLTGLLAGLNLLAMLTVGVFFVPITACLGVVCVRREGRGPASAVTA